MGRVERCPTCIPTILILNHPADSDRGDEEYNAVRVRGEPARILFLRVHNHPRIEISTPADEGGSASQRRVHRCEPLGANLRSGVCPDLESYREEEAGKQA
jgi:hypothetical protein